MGMKLQWCCDVSDQPNQLQPPIYNWYPKMGHVSRQNSRDGCSFTSPQRVFPSPWSLLLGAELKALGWCATWRTRMTDWGARKCQIRGIEMYPVRYTAPTVLIHFRYWESVYMGQKGLWTAGPSSINQSEPRAAVSGSFSGRGHPGSLPPCRS